MDDLALQAIFQELRPALLNQTIQKVRLHHHAPLTLSLVLRSRSILGISLFPSAPLCFLASPDVLSGSKASDQLASLRKFLVGARILDLKKVVGDRIFFFELEVRGPIPPLQKVTFVLELIPNRPNLLVIDEDWHVLVSMRRLRGTSIRTSTPYKPPLSKSPFRFDQIPREEFERLTNNLVAECSPENTPVVAAALGISHTSLREMLFGGHESGNSRWERLQAIIHRVRCGHYSPHIYRLDELPELTGTGFAETTSAVEKRSAKWFLTPFAFESLQEYPHTFFSTMSEACKELFFRLQEQNEFLALQRSMTEEFQKAFRKKDRLLRNLRADLARWHGCENYKKYSDLLYAQKERTPPGTRFLRTTDLFDPDRSEIEIPLDPKLSMIQNANRYSTLFQKANRTVPRVQKRIADLEAETTQLRDQLDNPAKAWTSEQSKAADTRTEATRPPAIEESRSSDISRRDVPGTTDSQPASLQRHVARQFTSSEGMEILVGKSSRDNETLTQRIAKADDFWLHVAGYGGSHVVLRNPKKLDTPPRQSLLEAAQLAAYFSQARNAPKAEVHYTQKKFLSKPKGTKPGLVQLRKHKSIVVRPRLL
jgi:predicted ribosome quality control (RQC) complex YloA/Tae2 family protein